MGMKNTWNRLSRKKMTTGTVVYYSIYLILIIAFFVGMTIATVALRNWLVSFEASQPNHKADQVFSQYFAHPDWAALYEEYGPIKGYESMDAQEYAAYMQSNVGNARIIKYKTSAGLSGGEKFVIRAVLADGSYYNFATFTLKELHPNTSTTANWQLSEIKLMAWSKNPPNRPTEPTDPTTPTEPTPPPDKPVVYHCTILTEPSNTVTVNGITLDESYIIRSVSTKAEEYLPAGLHGFRMIALYIDGLTEAPSVTVKDSAGNPVSGGYDEDTCTFAQDMTRPGIADTEKNAILAAATTYCKYMINAASKTELKQHFDSNKQIFATITGNDTWMQSYASYEFAEPQTISDYYRYSDSLFSAKITLKLNVSRKDGTVKVYDLDTTFFMEKQGDGWKAIQMTNVDVQARTTLVRLTYMKDTTVILSELVDADSNRLTSPAVTGGEDEIFLGWFTKTVAENGDITMDLKFRPDDSGKITLPADYTLEPMTLYALFRQEES